MGAKPSAAKPGRLPIPTALPWKMRASGETCAVGAKFPRTRDTCLSAREGPPGRGAASPFRVTAVRNRSLGDVGELAAMPCQPGEGSGKTPRRPIGWGKRGLGSTPGPMLLQSAEPGRSSIGAGEHRTNAGRFPSDELLSALLASAVPDPCPIHAPNVRDFPVAMRPATLKGPASPHSCWR